ncbi:hypothetical protein M8C21_027670, partial [Ambrosia artemisiifolia]
FTCVSRGRMESIDGNLTWQQPHPLSFQHFLLQPSFTHVNAIHPESDLLKIIGEGDEHFGPVKRRKLESSTSIQDEVDEDGLLLTLSLPNPMTQKSSNGSSSDISEVYSTTSVNDGSSNKPCSVNLDLSIALCGN